MFSTEGGGRKVLLQGFVRLIIIPFELQLHFFRVGGCFVKISRMSKITYQDLFVALEQQTNGYIESMLWLCLLHTTLQQLFLSQNLSPLRVPIVSASV